jgi:hypothetical protein
MRYSIEVSEDRKTILIGLLISVSAVLLVLLFASEYSGLSTLTQVIGQETMSLSGSLLSEHQLQLIIDAASLSVLDMHAMVESLAKTFSDKQVWTAELGAFLTRYLQLLTVIISVVYLARS